MALLIDEVRRLVPAWDEVKVNFPSKDPDGAVGEAAKHGEMLGVLLGQVQGKSVVRATNIAQWVRTEYAYGDLDYGSLECCMPPFPEMWLEWTGEPCMANSDGRNGVAVAAWRPKHCDAWLLLMMPVIINKDGEAGFTRCYAACRVDDDGRWEGVAAGDALSGRTLHMDEVPDDDASFLMSSAFVVFQTFCFMNCRGVRETVEEPSKTPLQRKWNRKAEKDGKKPLPLVSFTTVDIGPVIARGKTNGKSEPTGRHNRAHWTRGHVKRYPGLMLFGRIQLEKPGIWCPAFKSGRAKGEVKKAEYTVQAPVPPEASAAMAG